MKFERNKDYPTWNPKKVQDVPGIPTWTVKFGDIKITFSKGNKPCYVNQKKLKNGDNPCGDYTIQMSIPKNNLSDHKITDKKFIGIVKKSDCDIGDLKTMAENNFLAYTIENNLKTDLDANVKLSDLCKAFLYYAWHRCIIEERIYQQPHYGGSQTFLDVIK